ncbi:hypothetical protein [Acidisoma sp. C75]
MRWSQTYKARYPADDTADTADTKGLAAAGQGASVATVRCVTPAESDIEAAFLATERAALMAEGEGLDARAAVPHRLPPSWAEVTIEPTPGAHCVMSGDHRRWWTERVAPKGWRCWACHPPLHLPGDAVREVRT